LCGSGRKGGGLSGLPVDMGVMERSRCSGRCEITAPPIELCPAHFSVERSFLFLFGVLHGFVWKHTAQFFMFCGKKKKNKNIIYHILHAFLHQAKFKLEPLP
jgi:hypothetical protein